MSGGGQPSRGKAPRSSGLAAGRPRFGRPSGRNLALNEIQEDQCRAELEQSNEPRCVTPVPSGSEGDQSGPRSHREIAEQTPCAPGEEEVTSPRYGERSDDRRKARAQSSNPPGTTSKGSCRWGYAHEGADEEADRRSPRSSQDQRQGPAAYASARVSRHRSGFPSGQVDRRPRVTTPSPRYGHEVAVTTGRDGDRSDECRQTQSHPVRRRHADESLVKL